MLFAGIRVIKRTAPFVFAVGVAVKGTFVLKAIDNILRLDRARTRAFTCRKAAGREEVLKGAVPLTLKVCARQGQRMALPFPYQPATHPP